MISLETARKLKAAGLKWEPQTGDWYCYEGKMQVIKYDSEAYAIKSDLPEIDGYISAPRLDQLLSEIEKRSGRYKYELTGSRVYPLSNNPKPKYRITIQTDRVLPFFADSPEEATAQALLWILEQEQKQE